MSSKGMTVLILSLQRLLDEGGKTRRGRESGNEEQTTLAHDPWEQALLYMEVRGAARRHATQLIVQQLTRTACYIYVYAQQKPIK